MFDFDRPVSRLGSDSVKWDAFEADALPMWVADMDFTAAPCILDALQRRLDHGVFGYEKLPQAYFDTITSWFGRRHGWTGFGREQIIPTTGVIAAYSACIKALTSPGDRVIVMTPVYNCFEPVVRNNKCLPSCSPLLYRDGRYTIDFEDLERRAADPQTSCLLLCNPHNPVGRVWTREELLRIGDICLRHDLSVISDEIHCELTYPGHDYTPWGTLPEAIVRRSASCISPTKSFNIAGIQIANIVATDPELYRRIDRAINENECCDVNVFGATALVAAYNGGEGWLDELRAYLLGNAAAVREFFAAERPGLPILPLEGTYLLWIDCRGAMAPGEAPEGFSDRFSAHLRFRHKLIVSSGTLYGVDGEGFIRFNIAAPRASVLDGCRRLLGGLNSYSA